MQTVTVLSRLLRALPVLLIVAAPATQTPSPPAQPVIVVAKGIRQCRRRLMNIPGLDDDVTFEASRVSSRRGSSTREYLFVLDVRERRLPTRTFGHEYLQLVLKSGATIAVRMDDLRDPRVVFLQRALQEFLLAEATKKNAPPEGQRNADREYEERYQAAKERSAREDAARAKVATAQRAAIAATAAGTKAKCAEEWPKDFVCEEYCIGQQRRPFEPFRHTQWTAPTTGRSGRPAPPNGQMAFACGTTAKNNS